MSNLRITLKKSPIGYRRDQRATVRALGLTRLHQAVVKPDGPAIWGMIRKVRHLVEVVPAEDKQESAESSQ